MAFGRANAPYMYEVTRAFLRGEEYTKNSMSCSSSCLYSYGAIIAFWHKGEVVLNKRKYSTLSTYHQDVASNVIGDGVNRAWVDGQRLDSKHMLYQPKKHKTNIIVYDEISHYMAAAKLLKDRSHTMYAKKLYAMLFDHGSIDAHNQEVRDRRKKSNHKRDVDYFIKNTKIKVSEFKLGDKGTIGKITGTRFELLGLRGAGSVLKLKMSMASGFKIGDNVSSDGPDHQWSDGNMRITGVSKAGLRLNGKFITYKQIDRMLKRGDTTTMPF